MKQKISILITVITILMLLLSGCDLEVQTSQQPQTSDVELIIAEVMSSNRNTVTDAAGNSPDYIVLMNVSDKRISLNDYYLSDREDKAQKWELPDIYLEAGERLLVFASGTDSKENGEYHASFSIGKDGESLFLTTPTGQMTMVQVPALGYDMAYGITSTGYQYFMQGAPYGENTSPHAPTIEALAAFADYKISVTEYMNTNSLRVKDNFGEYPDWIELYNASEKPLDLTSMGLSDNDDPYKWRFPEGTVIPAGGYLTVWLSDRDGVLDGNIHAPFGLGSDDTVITLTDNAGTKLFSQELEYLPKDISKGRRQDAQGEWVYYYTPTPGAANTSQAYPDITSACALANRGVWINEVSAVPTNTSTDNYDWIELFNGTSEAIQLNGWGIGTQPDKPEYVFNDISIKAGGYLLLYAAGETPDKKTSGAVYLPFKIRTAGTTLYLFNGDSITDCFASGKLSIGTSSGRKGSLAERVFFATPTPKAENNRTAYSSYAAVPEVSGCGGYAQSGDKLYVSTIAGQTIRYTTDGSEPTEQSKAAGEYITIEKTSVIKIRAFRDGCLPSDTVSATYIVGTKHDIPVVSISAEPDDLFGYTTGILANGPGYKEPFPYSGANFWKDWERRITFEYFAPDGTKQLSFNGGAKVFGQYSRAYDQKSIAIHLRDQYGVNEVNYPFFEGNDITQISHLVLRAGGQDQSRTRIRDALCSEIMQGNTTLVKMDWQPVAVYINGEYWGYYDLREKINEEYLETHEGINPDTVTILKGDKRVIAGSNTEYLELVSYIRNHDMSNSDYYNYVADRIDIDNYIDYLITEIFFGNGDTGNIKFYKAAEDGAKWRWIMFDFDMTLRNECTWGDRYNTIEMLFNPEGHGSNNAFTTVVQRNLLKNAGFKEKFASRYAQLLNTIFMPDSMNAVLDRMTKQIDSEMKLHGERWKKPEYQDWLTEITALKSVIGKRRNIAKDQMIKYLGLSSEQTAQLFPNG